MTEQLTKTLQVVLAQALSNLHTATIAKVTAVGEKTIDCQPVINRVVDGEEIHLPVFAEVPPVFLQGGGSSTSYPIAVDDYCLLIFTERCFDRWYDGDDFAAPAELRMHDYSDGFAIVGINPLAAAITIPSVITQQGDTDQFGNYNHTGDLEQEGDYDQTGNQTVNGIQTINGSLVVNGGGGGSAAINNVTLIITTGDVVADGISLKNHTHQESGGGTTGPAQ
jgi:hypothetical protein